MKIKNFIIDDEQMKKYKDSRRRDEIAAHFILLILLCLGVGIVSFLIVLINYWIGI